MLVQIYLLLSAYLNIMHTCLQVLPWKKHNPRRTDSNTRKVIFDELKYSKNKISEKRQFELFWLMYSLAMPSYEKSVAILDTFENDFVLHQEYEHSRVHVKLNDSYENYYIFKYFKLFWRIYFNLIMSSPFKELLIIGEIQLQYNCMDVQGRLEMFQSADMSNVMKKVLVYHDLEEIEHGLDLVPLIMRHNMAWRIVLFCVYTVNCIIQTLALEIQTILTCIHLNPIYTVFRKIPVILVRYMKEPYTDIRLNILYSLITGRYPSAEFRNERIDEYKKLSMKMFGIDFNKSNVVI